MLRLVIVGEILADKELSLQVAPAELEALLITHTSVQDAAVIGVDDERAGELPTAFVVINNNQPTTEEELTNYVSGKQTQRPKQFQSETASDYQTIVIVSSSK